MVLYTGLWNIHQNYQDEEEENDNDNSNSNSAITSSNDNHNDYGSLLYGSNSNTNTNNTSKDNDNDNDDNKKVSWKQNHHLARDMETGQNVAQAGSTAGATTSASDRARQDRLLDHQDSTTATATTSNAMMENDEQSHSTSSSSSGSSSQDPQQQLPGLTGAFTSLENRSILRNCMWYLLIYFAVAIVAYSFVFEQWTIIDSLYFAVATFTTCGYGDLEPTTSWGQLFTIVFAIYGVIILGVFIGIFGNFISQAQTKTMRKLHKQKQKQILQAFFPTHTKVDDANTKKEEEDNHEDRTPSVITTTTKTNTKPKQLTAIETTGFWRDHISLADDTWNVVKSEFLSIALVAVLAIILGVREHWGMTSTLYFSIMAATTTGYGDYTPATQLDKLYCVVFLPLAVAVFGEVLGRIASVYIQRQQRRAETKFLHRTMTLCDLRKMDVNEDGAVDREEFVNFMLIALQKVDRSTIEELQQIFDSLDKNGNGILEADDLVELAEEHYVPTMKRVRQLQQQHLHHQRQMAMSSTDFTRLLFGNDIVVGGGRGGPLGNSDNGYSNNHFDSNPQQPPPQQQQRHRRGHTIF